VPLVAHERILGILAVVRREGAPLFDERDEQRLEAIGDHAALALWKSHLLEEAQGASQAKSNFLATISHELRTPLTALTGYGELLADEILGPMPKPQHEVIDRMRSVTHHLSAMIDEILTFSSLEAGREAARIGDIEAGELVRAAAAVVEPLARQKGIEFVLDLPPAPLPMLTDGDKIRQILVNLAGNAVKFTEMGSVTVTLQRRGDDVDFAVRDTGIGISTEDRSRLFQPFTQLDSSLTRRHGGTGLGLYISIRLARLLSGRIDVESEPNVGSTFTLVVPARLRPASGSRRATQS
jgi:signal transduction histidine kinase